MKLIVSQLEALRTYVTREFYYIMSDLISTHGWRTSKVSNFLLVEAQYTTTWSASSGGTRKHNILGGLRSITAVNRFGRRASVQS
jgi:hypothetical protein